MPDFIKPIHIDEERYFDTNKVLMCKTDKEGILEFANREFVEVSGFSEPELMGKSIFRVQHPDMPEVIFKMMWEKIDNKEEFKVVVKDLAKDGRYFWTLTVYSVTLDEKGEIKAIYSKRFSITQETKTFFSKLYKTLTRIENKKSINGIKDIKSSEKFLKGYLEENQLDFQNLIDRFQNNTTDQNISETSKNQIQLQAVKSNTRIPQKNSVPTSKTSVKSKPQKKGFFQRFFGMTEEEIEAKKKRNK